MSSELTLKNKDNPPAASFPEERGNARHRSHTVSSLVSVSDGLKRALSPSAVAKRSLSPLRTTMSTSLDTLTRIGSTITPTRKKDHSTIGLDDDIAQPNRLAKSFVSFLTTASLYNGTMEDLIDTPDNEEGPISSETEDEIEQTQADIQIESQKTGEPGQTQEINERQQIDQSDFQDDESSIGSAVTTEEVANPADSPLLIHENVSLFDISVTPKPNSDGTKLDTRAKVLSLSEKLKKSLKITDEDTFLADYRCWLIKDIVLQGNMIITTRHLLFFAFLPKIEKDTVVLSGALSIESKIPSPKLSRYWAVLRQNTLSLYNNASDLYFPVLTINLKTAVKAEVISDTESVTTQDNVRFRIVTETKSYKLNTDSDSSARSWVSSLKKQIFAARNDGDYVTVKVPLQNILDVEETPILETTETLKIRVLESSSSYAIDDYFFMFFNSGPEVTHILSDAVEAADGTSSSSSYDEVVLDSTAIRELNQRNFRPMKSIFSHLSLPGNNSNVKPKDPELVKGSTDVDEPVVEQFVSGSSDATNESNGSVEALRSDLMNILPDFGGVASKSISHAKSTLGKFTPKVLKSAPSMWAAAPVHYSEKNSLERGSEDEYLASAEEREEKTKRFQKHFSLSSSNVLVATYYAYLQRNMPIYGKVYLGSEDICFRSLVPGFNTKMILPFKDIENCYKEKGFKFGYYGLVIVIHGHEELFFEFSSVASRDDCEFLILKQLDAFSSTKSNDLTGEMLDSSATDSKMEAAKLKLLEDKIQKKAGVQVPIIFEDNPLMNTLVKPIKPYKISLLTIGSRGDVQPYISLGKGLLKEGHEVTILTHIEFKDWIISHGIKFKEIAGNPTELMSLMVSHGSMNVGLYKEASGKFRGWIKDLLKTSWEACEGTEILIESPSAMAGIHIAEALNIPYFRAFTMPWTRTRAYPHAFIVPDQKQGGSYNYLTHVLFENIFWKGISGQVNKWRKETLGLPKTNLDLLQQNKVPFLYNVSPTVMPPPVDYSDWIKVTGYWFLNESSDYEPPENLVKFISNARADGKKVVYIGFGSIVVNNPKELTEAVVEAVLLADVRCILNKGWSERLGGSKKIEVKLPVEIFNAGTVPHDWLFPQIDAAVHHGGSGTTGATLRAGLPTIIKPFFGDQFFYAARVEDIGAGISLRKLNVKSLAKALKEATTNQRMISKAKAIGVNINNEDGVATAIESIYRELEYAKELIQKKRQVQIANDNEIDKETGDEEILKNIKELDTIAENYTDDDLESSIGNDGSWYVI